MNPLVSTAILDSDIDEMASHDVKHVQEQAALGNPEAQYHLGLLHDTGRLLERDPRKALYWYHKAAEKGHSGGAYRLARLYDSEESGVAKDVEKARFWYQRAEQFGNLFAAQKLAELMHS